MKIHIIRPSPLSMIGVNLPTDERAAVTQLIIDGDMIAAQKIILNSLDQWHKAAHKVWGDTFRKSLHIVPLNRYSGRRV